MATQQLPAELERRISALEQEGNQGEGFTGGDWLWLAILGVIVLLLLVMAALFFTHSSEGGAAMALITGAVPAG